MTFEEFFKKKKIDLMALQAAQPGLFSEFKDHFEKMGEKSFDHTKKYWFNKLRLQYYLAPEVKVEKVIIENKLAEQTITAALAEAAPAPSVGFKPRFKAGMGSKPADTASDKKDLPEKDAAAVTPEANEAAAKHEAPAFEQQKAEMQQQADQMPRNTDGEAKEDAPPTTLGTGFKPRFNMKMAQGKAPQTKEFEQDNPPGTEPEREAATDEAEQAAAPKPAGFKPRFNAKTMAAKPVEDTGKEPGNSEPVNTEKPDAPVEAPAPKPAGFKPRFNAKTMGAKPVEDTDKEPGNPEPPANTEQADVPEQTASKPAGFKPRFNMKMVAPKPDEIPGTATESPAPTEDEPADTNEVKNIEKDTEAVPKLGFKPRFNPKTTKPQSPGNNEEEK
ncbi:hypothetical protein ACFQZX_11700 [Mucilaginibacter litoreus]|uniref:Uncharacterized protein n=1 Tax=Mucilaginibacter litoreus TaxID=1048221 RepID=A0ABW3AT85_9SPHI